MIGVAAGIRPGINAFGIAAGISADPLGGSGTAPSMSGVARDATSLKYLPASSAQWTQTLAFAGIGSGGPSALHLLQEASGNPADSVGTFTLTATGTLTYQQAVSGWTSKGIKTTAGTAGIMQSTSASLPNIATTSMLALVYMLVPAAVAGTRSAVTLGPVFGTQAAANVTASTNHKAQCVDGGNTASGADDSSGGVRPFLLQIDRTHSVVELVTDLERITPTFSATPTGAAYILGGDNGQTNFPDNFVFMYSAVFFGAAAEMSLGSKRSLLQALGWSPSW